MNEWMKKNFNEIKTKINEIKWMNKRMNEWMNWKWMNEKMNEWIENINEWKRKNEWMKEWI
jgi:hypothetical protein